MPVISGGRSTQPGKLLYQSILFTETSGAGTYTGALTIPAGAILQEVGVHGIALWNASGAVNMDVGDASVAQGMLIVTSLKSGGDLLAGETLAIGGAAGTDGGETGSDITGNMWTRRYLSTERVITGTLVAAGTSGTTGRTLMYVVYTDPTIVPDATKV